MIHEHTVADTFQGLVESQKKVSADGADAYAELNETSINLSFSILKDKLNVIHIEKLLELCNSAIGLEYFGLFQADENSFQVAGQG